MKEWILLFLFLLILPVVSAQGLDLNNFIIEPLSLQLGDEFIAEGYTSLDSGFVIVYLENTGTVREFPGIIGEGKFSINGKLLLHESEEGIPSGTYGVSVLVKDGFGHERLYQNVKAVEVLTGLVTEVSLKKEELDPGDELVIEGVVEDMDGKAIGGEIIVVYDEEEIVDEFSRGGFIVEYKLKESISSGEHKVYVTVKDEFGNVKEILLTFEVIPREESLSLELYNSYFGPGDELGLNAVLLDQAGAPIDSELNFILYDPKGDEFFVDSFFSESEYYYTIPSFAKPGTWRVLIKSDSLEDRSGFTISEKLSLDAWISGNNLVLSNGGNVRYSSSVKIIAKDNNGETFEFTKRTGLGPNETVSINLLTELEEGVYTVLVLDKVFSDVYLSDDRSLIGKVSGGFKSISGNVVAKPGSSTSNLPFIISVLVLVFVIAYLANVRFKIVKKKERHFIREKKKAENLKTRLLNLRSKTPKFRFGKASESDVNHFKERVLKDIREREDAEKDRRKEEYLKGFLKRENVEPKKMDFERPFPPEEKKEEPIFDFGDSEEKNSVFESPVEEKKKDSEGSLFKMFD